MGNRLLAYVAMVTALVVSAPAAHAQEIVYRPVNPAFGGNPLNASYLIATAEAQNRYKDPDDALALLEQEDPNAQFNQFVRQLQARLLSRLSSEVTDAIFGKPDQPAQKDGEIEFGDQVITFDNLGNEIVLELTNTVTLARTTIRIPTLQPKKKD